MADSPTTGADGPVGITIKAEGTVLDSTLLVRSVRVETSLNRIPEAVIQFLDGEISAGEYPLVDADTLKPGAVVEIATHWGGGEDQTLFKGIVTAMRLKIRGDVGPLLEVTCRDKAAWLTGARRTAVFEKQKDSDVISKIVADAGLTAEVSATTAPPADLVQHDCSDWDFLRLLADRNGHVLLVDDGKVTSKPPDLSAAAVMTLTVGQDVIELNTALDVAPLVKTVKLRGWDPATLNVTLQQKEAAQPAGWAWGNLGFADLVTAAGNRTHEMLTPYAAGPVALNDVATARVERAPLAMMRGTVRYIGSTLATPGTSIELGGVGERMGGTAYVSGVRHEIDAATGWTTTAHLGLPPDWRSDVFGPGGPMAGGLAAPVHGLVPATVVALTGGDAAVLADVTLIKVSAPLLGDPPPQLWARYIAPYATKGMGLQFLPEIGDEVILGFLGADPTAPVILGSVHGGSNTRSAEAANDNFIKLIHTKSGLKVTFDDEKKVITVETPGGHKVTLDDDAKELSLVDLTGNSVKMTSSGVTVDSTGTLDLKASGNITISSSGGDVAVTGTNVELSANAQLTAKGNASAELSASGQTTVKGAMVMIN
jgi:phage protein D